MLVVMLKKYDNIYEKGMIEMKRKLLIYIDRIDLLLASESRDTDWNSVLEDHLNQIRFFQHERLVHLLVTISFGIFLLLVANLLFSTDEFYAFTGILAIFVILVITTLFYIFHYFFLENHVHKLYDQYDEIRKRI